MNSPGSFSYVNGMTVINAVALAGGFTYRADQDDIVISRGGSSGPEIEAAPDTKVLPGDIIEVPGAVLLSVAGARRRGVDPKQ